MLSCSAGLIFNLARALFFPFPFFLSIFLEKGKQSDLRMLTIATMESWLRRNVSFNARQELNFTTTEWLDKSAMHERNVN